MRPFRRQSFEVGLVRTRTKSTRLRWASCALCGCCWILNEASYGCTLRSRRGCALRSLRTLLRRLGGSEGSILMTQGNLANTYAKLGRLEKALPLKRDVYFGTLKLLGEEHSETLMEAGNYATSLSLLRRIKEAKSLLRKTIPVARRVQREGDENTLRLGWNYARALHELSLIHI